MKELLERREQLGLRFALIFNLVMLLFFVWVTFAAAQSLFEVVTTLAVIGIGAVFIVGFLIFNFRGRLVGFSGWTLTFMYIAIDLALPWIWYQSVGGDPVPRTYFLKVAIGPMNYIMLVLCCLAGRPWYPAAFTLGATAGLVSHVIVALGDPRTLLTENILDSVQGPGASLPLTVMNDVVFVASGVLLTIILVRFQQTVVAASQAEHSTAQLGRYFSPGLVPLIARSDSSFLKPGGQLQTVTILFSDIRGFTSLSEGMTPARVVELLSLYQEQMVGAIFEHGGTLDKFIGDGIMATFGTPQPVPDDARRAVEAALAMQTRLHALNETLESRGFPRLRQGIGIHTGPVIAGNVGTASRLEYTVIGDTVNTASRIESLCKETGDSLLVSQRVTDAVGDAFSWIPRGELPLKGKSATMAVFAVQVTP